MSWRWRDGLYLVAGAAVGWQLNVCSRVEGVSMMPTLTPQDRLLHVPYWLWRRAHSAILWQEDSSTELNGRVVTMLAGNANVVCKRVKRVATSAAEVEALHNERFQSLESLPYSAVAHDEDPDSPPQAEEEDRMSREQYVDPRPFRRTDWDNCREDDSLPLPQEWVWVEGDNAEDSFDSRSVGFVPVHCIRDVVVGRLWPSPRSL
jgi:hypothetical protein